MSAETSASRDILERIADLLLEIHQLTSVSHDVFLHNMIEVALKHVAARLVKAVKDEPKLQ